MNVYRVGQGGRWDREGGGTGWEVGQGEVGQGGGTGRWDREVGQGEVGQGGWWENGNQTILR